MSTGSCRGAYLFQENNLIVPEDIPDSRAAGGIGEETAKAAFGDLPWHNIPAVDGKSHIPGFMLEPGRSLPPSWRRVPLRGLVSLLAEGVSVDGSGDQGGLLRAYHILQWRRDSAYCGSCGNPNGDAPMELARLCPVCGRLEYPRISPAIIALVITGDGRALLARNRKFTNNMYSLIAGFAEAGENLEAAVAREVREEVGLAVKNTRYEASQPWPFPNSLMIGFTTRYAGGTIRPDGEEIVDARWFRADKLPELPGKGSVSRFLIDKWLEGRFRQG